jgi:hypothetical protein
MSKLARELVELIEEIREGSLVRGDLHFEADSPRRYAAAIRLAGAS